MRSTWRVKRVTATEDRVMAELVRVEWINKNPAYTAMMDEYDDLMEAVGREEADRITAERDDEFVPEWLEDVQPDDEGADYIETDFDALTIDITGGLDLAAGENVFLTLDALGAQ